MRFAVYSEDDGVSVPALVVGEDTLVPLHRIWSDALGEDSPLEWPAGYATLFDKGATLSELAEAAAERFGLQVGAVQLLAPAIAPGKILCVGLNYTDHVAEVGFGPPIRPHVFSKLRTALNSPGGEVMVPWDVTSQIDYEAELAIVMGAECKNVPVEKALDHVLGYTVANDLSARDWQFASDDQLTLGKGFDGFFPIGPWVVSLDELDDPDDLRIRCWVDGELRQDASIAQMVAGPAEIIAFLSKVCTLEPGDVIATGTPAGVGFGRSPQQFIAEGQTVRTEIEGIGALVNKVN